MSDREPSARATSGATFGQLGRYRLIQPLGVGGMAEAFRATYSGPAGFERTVVVKRILPANCADPEFLQMFAAEARILGMLHHPNVVQVYDFGESDGTFFLVLEYVDGPSLGRLLKTLRKARRPIPAADRRLHRARDLPRPRLRARPADQRRRAAERDPPRRHPVEHHADDDGSGEAARLRNRQVRNVRDADAAPDRQGQDRLHRAGDHRGAALRRAGGSVLPGRRVPRDPDADAAVRGRQRPGDAAPGDGDARRAPVTDPPRRPRASGRHRADRAAARSGSALCERARRWRAISTTS